MSKSLSSNMREQAHERRRMNTQQQRQEQQARQRVQLRNEARIMSSDASDADKIAALVALGYAESIARMMLDFHNSAISGATQ